jgi:hypothetical protein
MLNHAQKNRKLRLVLTWCPAEETLFRSRKIYCFGTGGGRQFALSCLIWEGKERSSGRDAGIIFLLELEIE